MMSLRGVLPSAVQKRFKMMIYGPSGVGKTMAAISFPRPYMIDCEKGCENEQYVEKLIETGGSYYFSRNFDDIYQEVYTLATEKHEFKTLVIDPLTIVYNEMLDKSAALVGTQYGKHRGEPNRQMKRLLNLLLQLDMNVIITAHAKTEYSPKLEKLGNTFDCYSKIDFLFDLVLEIEKLGKVRTAIVKKTRLKNFDEMEEFEFSYDAIAERYGAHELEKDAKPIEFATEEQLGRLNNLLAQVHVPKATVEKWLDKANCEKFEEMPKHILDSCISWLENKLT